MSDSNATALPKKGRSKKLARPKKPYPDFPLTPHASGKYMKKIRGKIHYFGRWAKVIDGTLTPISGDGWQDALAVYKAQADDLHAGRTPRRPGETELPLKELCNRFLTAKQRRLDVGEITRRSFEEYKASNDLVIATFGVDRLVDDLASDDFENLRDVMAKRWGPVRLGNEIGKVKTIFKYAFTSGLIKTAMRYGEEFRKPSAAVMRKHRAKSGGKMLEAAECRKLLDIAPTQLRAMILLGLNCGFGNHDCATLPESALDLDGGWIDYPRPKTGIDRRCPLWPETVTAIRKAIAERPKPRHDDAEGLVFVTLRGRQWLSNGIAHPVSAAVGPLFRTAKIYRPGIGFYTLRHVMRTAGDAARDPVAINLIMGHAASDGIGGSVYRERIDDSRLRAVANVVRAWLFPNGGAK